MCKFLLLLVCIAAGAASTIISDFDGLKTEALIDKEEGHSLFEGKDNASPTKKS